MPVPERVGEPSVFKHVIYVIKENRTYDQILGDMKEGNGDAELCIFGEKYTPNQHKIAREFVLLDNTYCSGVQSADGHQWTDSAIANGYMERQVTAGFPRSYPGGKTEDGQDALAWASSGFIWDNALAHGKTFRNYGEWMLTEMPTGRTPRARTSRSGRSYWDDYQDRHRPHPARLPSGHRDAAQAQQTRHRRLGSERARRDARGGVHQGAEGSLKKRATFPIS